MPLTLLFFFSLLQAAPAEELFPVPDFLEPNVKFWENIYSRYTTTQGVLHDQENLAIVYTVVNLVDWNTSGSARVNRKLIKLARQHYQAILSELAEGKEPVTEDEKRVAAMFPGNSHKAYREARDNIRLQIGQSDRFLEGHIRSGAYLAAFKKIFAAQGLPQQLVYLPHVESSFNSRAHSKAGAAGLWQFTRSTGRQYMRVDNIIDQRYDPYYATQAAARLLKDNFAALGSWPLAITAYNHGRNGMLRAAREYGSYEKIFQNHESRLFRFASRNFYSEFVAALNVARRLEKDPRIIPDRPEGTILVKMTGYILTSDIQSHFGISNEDLVRLNPALQPPVLAGQKFIPKNFYVRLPATDRVRELASVIPADLYHAHQIRDREYIVRRGDTAGAIARRYDISLPELVAANNLNSKAMIRLGQVLKIPPRPVKADNSQVVLLQASSKIKPN